LDGLSNFIKKESHRRDNAPKGPDEKKSKKIKQPNERVRVFDRIFRDEQRIVEVTNKDGRSLNKLDVFRHSDEKLLACVFTGELVCTI